MVSKLNLFITPSVFGKLLKSNIESLAKLGLFIEYKRTATERLWNAIYKEPLDDDFEDNNLKSKEETYGS